MKRTAFFLSTGRTGTQFLAFYFDKNFEGVRALHEPFPSYLLRAMSNAHTAGMMPAPVLLPAFKLARSLIFSRLPQDHEYIESNYYLYGMFDALCKLDPAPIMFHIIRDPRAYIRSHLNHGTWQGYKWLVSNVVPYWIPDVRYILKPLGLPMTPINRFAAIWLHTNNYIREHGKKYAHYHLYRFEDLFKPPYPILQEMCVTLGLTPREEIVIDPSEKVNYDIKEVIGPWKTWTPEQCRQLDQICGSMMREFGYGDEPEWKEKIAG
jgi:hypothetical protein